MQLRQYGSDASLMGEGSPHEKGFGKRVSGRAADRHASECNQQKIHGLAKWNIYSGKTVRREMKSSMAFLSCDADGLSAVVLR